MLPIRKAVDRGMVINGVGLLEKAGVGKSGHWVRGSEDRGHKTEYGEQP